MHKIVLITFLIERTANPTVEKTLIAIKFENTVYNLRAFILSIWIPTYGHKCGLPLLLLKFTLC